ncbi:MAG: hypothetical protein Harvfovirus21_12 [Harvfovirus sp.]|uniref:Uncharacterized protein n=1 Tax=Harvfovirus sp. TaxID=2487768 RepID=A0A3G5A1Y8_9VIRU|nr:MAG: hypothetical protein Harvfovirus21_12 [Harvfovirus sp.]
MYAVKENNSDIFTTTCFDIALHEMISILNSRVSFLKGNIDQISDIYIEEFIPCEGKRFRYCTNKYTYDLKTHSIETLHTKQTNLSAPCQQILNVFKQSFNGTPLIKNPVQTPPQQFYTGVANINPLTNPQDLITKNNSLSKTLTAMTTMLSPQSPLPQRKIEPKDDDSYVNLSTSEDEDLQPDNTNIEDSELKSLEGQILSLKKIKQTNKTKMKQIRQLQDKQTENLIDYSADVNYAKKKLFQQNEREEEKRKKFNANKRAYLLMKEDIGKGIRKRDKISPMFTDYPIFEYLDQKNLLTAFNSAPDDDSQNAECAVSTDYFLFNELTKKDTLSPETPYVPHNYNYISKEEQLKYTPFLNNKKGMIEDFLTKRKRIRPLTDILEDLDNLDITDLADEISESSSKSDSSNISEIPDIKLEN